MVKAFGRQTVSRVMADKAVSADGEDFSEMRSSFPVRKYAHIQARN